MESLKTLTDNELINSLHVQVQEERRITAQVIRLLEEVDKRYIIEPPDIFKLIGSV